MISISLDTNNAIRCADCGQRINDDKSVTISGFIANHGPYDDLPRKAIVLHRHCAIQLGADLSSA
jgi:hypothetical protein